MLSFASVVNGVETDWAPVVSKGIFMKGWQKVQVGNDQEKAQSEKDSHSKNRGGKN